MVKSLFSSIYESFAEIKNHKPFEKLLPNGFKEVTPPSNPYLKLSQDFTTKQYYLMDGNRIAAVIDCDWINEIKLVNCNLLFVPSELDSMNVMNEVYYDIIQPYLKKITGSQKWDEYMVDQFYHIVEKKSLVIFFKYYFDHPVSFSISIIDRDYTGI